MRFRFAAAALAAALCVAQAPLVAQTLWAQNSRVDRFSHSLAPYVVSPQGIVDRMLELADLRPGETLFDLGAGDGRVLITAVQRFHAKAVGVEISEELCKATEKRIRSLNLQDDAKVVHGDLMGIDLSPADVVTLYLMTDANAKLRPNMERYLKHGARVVSHDYPVPGWEPKYVEHADVGEKHVIYLYQVSRVKK